MALAVPLCLKALASIKLTTEVNRIKKLPLQTNHLLKNQNHPKRMPLRSQPKEVLNPRPSDCYSWKVYFALPEPNDSPIYHPMPHCPVCNAVVFLRDTFNQPATPTAPFCSARCKNIDLGRWLDESYSIPDDAKESEDDNDGESYGARY